MNENEEEEETKILELPIDVLLKVLSYIVDFETFRDISVSCKSFYTLCKVNMFWKIILPNIKDSLEHYINGKINNYHFFKRINLSYSEELENCEQMEANIFNQYRKLLQDCEKISKLVAKEISRRKKVEMFNQKYKTKLLWKVIQHSTLFVSLFLVQTSFVFSALTLDSTLYQKIFQVTNFTTFVMIFLIFAFLQGFEIAINRKYPFPLSRIDIQSCLSRKERKKVKKFIISHEEEAPESPRSKKKRKKKEFLLKWKKRWAPQWKKRVNQHYETLFTVEKRRRKRRKGRKKTKLFHLESASKGYLGSEEAHQYIWESQWVQEKNESILCSVLSYFNWVFYMLFVFGLKIFVTSEYFMWSIVSIPALLYMTIYTFCLFWLLQKNIRKKTSKLLVLCCLVGVSLSLSFLVLVVCLKLDFFPESGFSWSFVLILPVTILMISILVTPCVFCCRFLCYRKNTMAYREKLCFNILIIIAISIAAIFLESFTILLGLSLDHIITVSFFVSFIPMFLFVLIIHALSAYMLYYSIRAFTDKSTDDYLQSL